MTKTRNYIDIIQGTVTRLQEAPTVEIFLQAVEKGLGELFEVDATLRELSGPACVRITDPALKEIVALLFARIDTTMALLMLGNSPAVYAQPQVVAALQAMEEDDDDDDEGEGDDVNDDEPAGNDFSEGLSKLLRKK